MKITDDTPFGALAKQEHFLEAMSLYLPLAPETYPTLLKMTVGKIMTTAWGVTPEQGRTFYPAIGDIAERLTKKNFFYRYGKKDHSVFLSFPVEHAKGVFFVLPGGAYISICGYVEGYPLIQHLNQAGYSAILCGYGIFDDAAYPGPIQDLAEAVKYAREQGLWDKSYGVLGCSAAGHVASLFGTKTIGYAHYGLPRPSFIILAYPVISLDKVTDLTSKRHFLGQGNEDDLALARYYSSENQVDAHYPPTFIWRAEKDPCVAPINSDSFVKALKAHHIPYEYHVYPGEGHGWGDGEGTSAKGWMKTAIAFFEKLK
jgi:acetyl esterase/lipase